MNKLKTFKKVFEDLKFGSLWQKRYKFVIWSNYVSQAGNWQQKQNNIYNIKNK